MTTSRFSRHLALIRTVNLKSTVVCALSSKQNCTTHTYARAWQRRGDKLQATKASGFQSIQTHFENRLQSIQDELVVSQSMFLNNTRLYQASVYCECSRIYWVRRSVFNWSVHMWMRIADYIGREKIRIALDLLCQTLQFVYLPVCLHTKT